MVQEIELEEFRLDPCLPRMSRLRRVTPRPILVRERGARIDEIVLHDTGSAPNHNFDGTVSYLASGSLNDFEEDKHHPGVFNRRAVSIHFVVGRENSEGVVAIVPEQFKASHVAAAGHNDRSIGIEQFRRDNDSPDFTVWQYETVAQLVYYLVRKHQIPNEAGSRVPGTNIVGHGDIQPRNRRDPTNFDWTFFTELLRNVDDCQKRLGNAALFPSSR